MTARATWLVLMAALALLGFLNVITMVAVCSEEDPRFCSLLDTGGLPVVGFIGVVPFVTGLFGVTMLHDPQLLARLNWLVFVLAGVLLTFTWVGTTGSAGIVFAVVWLLTAVVAGRKIRQRRGPPASASAES
jgi:NhaP-type Na+/H+ and K+/H+ antiporter